MKFAHKTLLVALAALALLVAPSAGLASSGTSYLYNQRGSSSLVYHYQGGNFVYLPNGSAVHMLCWFDSTQFYTFGNYYTNRTFDVTVNGRSGTYAVNSSYVYYQTSVGPC